MTHATRYLATGSIVALMTAFSLAGASAQDRNRMGGGDNGRPVMQDNNCVGVECMPDQGGAPERMQKPDDSNAGKIKGDSDKRRQVNRDNDGGNDRVDRNRQARNDWKYDSNRHKRSRNKEGRYRYYYGGYWYLEPYWDGPVYSRVSCGEGREIINDSGFSRVRTIECSGRNYTYAARRHGDIFRVALNSRTGEIVSVRPM